MVFRVVYCKPPRTPIDTTDTAQQLRLRLQQIDGNRKCLVFLIQLYDDRLNCVQQLISHHNRDNGFLRDSVAKTT